MPAASDEVIGAGGFTYDWNEATQKPQAARPVPGVVDETLRDGLQSPSAKHPTIDDKLRILHLMEGLGIDCVNVGLPSSGKRAFEDALRLCREAADCRMRIGVSAAGRTVAGDIEPIVEISQRTGVGLEACVFIGSSPIRQYVEGWDLDFIAKTSAKAIEFASRAGLPVTYVTEDSTRSRPEVLGALFRTAIRSGASRLVLTDTVGEATHEGVRNLIAFTKSVIIQTERPIGIDWHGHNDRGLALDNALRALEFGADRVHGTALGIGERVGNAPMELILINLQLSGRLGPGRDLTTLVRYCETVAAALSWTIPPNQPLVGHDAFRTATGVHAAAIVKALDKGDRWAADRIYSALPAGLFGRRQEIAIGPMSGASNVAYWLRQRSIDPTDDLVEAILNVAKSKNHLLADREILAVVDRVRCSGQEGEPLPE